MCLRYDRLDSNWECRLVLQFGLWAQKFWIDDNFGICTEVDPTILIKLILRFAQQLFEKADRWNWKTLTKQRWKGTSLFSKCWFCEKIIQKKALFSYGTASSLQSRWLERWPGKLAPSLSPGFTIAIHNLWVSDCSLWEVAITEIFNSLKFQLGNSITITLNLNADLPAQSRFSLSPFPQLQCFGACSSLGLILFTRTFTYDITNLSTVSVQPNVDDYGEKCLIPNRIRLCTKFRLRTELPIMQVDKINTFNQCFKFCIRAIYTISSDALVR